MFTQSFHNHTWRCNHATGTEREYVENAVAHDMTMLGFSDHAPYVFENGYYSGFRMKPDQIKGYFETIGALKEEYKGKIQIFAGFEAEYYPKFFGEFLKLIDDYPCEYLLLGQHFLYNEMEGRDSFNSFTEDKYLIQYVDQVSEALSTGKFCCVAHPDVIHYEGSPALYEKEITRLCENAKKYSVPLEINLLGIRTHRHYPNMKFWEIAGQVGNTVVCGSDAHAAKDVWDGASFGFAMEMARKYRLKWTAACSILKGGHSPK